MTGLDIKKFAAATALGLAIWVIGSSNVNAQSRRDIERERQRIEKQNARYRRDQRRNDNSSRVSSRTEQRITNANYATGYEQGFIAGQFDRRKRKYNQSNVYRDTGSYPNQGDPTSNDYVYRQGYLQGYNDGFNGIRNY